MAEIFESPRGRGRPKGPETKFINLRVKKAEHEQIEKLMRSAGMTEMSKFIRHCIEHFARTGGRG